MTHPVPEIRIAGRRPAFVPMVTNNWLLSGERGPLASRVDRRVYSTYEHALIERYWKDPGMVWLFATNPADSNYAYGWLCGESTNVGPVLHYLYVRGSMRNSRDVYTGFAEVLLRTFIGGCGHTIPVPRVTHTRTTPAFERMLARDESVRGLADEFFYNPFIGFAEFAPNRAIG